MGKLLDSYVLNMRTASFVFGFFFVVGGASEVNGIDEVVDDTVDEIVVVGIVVDGIVVDALAFVK